MTDDHHEESPLDLEPSANSQGPVECLGMTFESDDERREYFLEKLREKLQDPEFREIEGFPIGEDEDILALSDPPYYTACPNPFIEDFIAHYGQPYDPETDDYHREPFSADVSEGRSGLFYDAHAYHTKVPHKAIMRYILHYTEPGDVVLDSFCGTGMTGVAAQLCGDKNTVESLGYRVDKNGTIYQRETSEDETITWKNHSKLGTRKAILNDLSPAATFITYNYNMSINIDKFEYEAKRILKEVENECGWMYETFHTDGETKGRINYIIWSDVFVCPECIQEVIFWEAAVDKGIGQINEKFPCPHCNAQLTKRNMNRAWIAKHDNAINENIRQAKQIPVLINYSVGKKRYEKEPDSFDLDLVEKIERTDIPYWFPISRMPEGLKTKEPKNSHGLTHVYHYYTKRNLWILAALRNSFIRSNPRMTMALQFLLSSYNLTHSTKMTRIIFKKGGKKPVLTGYQTGTLYASSLPVEKNIFTGILFQKLPIITESLRHVLHPNLTETADTSCSVRKNLSVDYIFTDPPFGGNIMYSELNFLWEAWLAVFTNNKSEAVENQVQGKGLPEYQQLMTEGFKEYYRTLKYDRWMTVEFHNSKNSVWNSIQEALQVAGFVIADVRILDKKQGSFNQVTSANAVKQDLVISCYKPNGELEERFKCEAGAEDGVWDFTRTHMKQLPVFVSKNKKVEIIAERSNYLLFDRMVAFHIQRGVIVPVSASEFYAGLEQRFPSRDGMYFLPDQAAEYDKKRMTVKEVLQLELFVMDEASAIQWLKQQLTQKPQTFQDIHPLFLKEISGWQKHEKSLELSVMLEQNFLLYDGQGDVPSQIHKYLSSNYKEFRNLEKDDSALKARAKDRWYVPDPSKAGDLEKLRERALLREFEEYLGSKQKRLKVFRSEAVRAGFKKAWQDNDYNTIIAVAHKIHENVLQEDPKLLMWYDQALTRVGDNP